MVKKQEKIVVLGTAHLGTTPGKCSPDGRLKEAAYSREIVGKVAERLRAQGYAVYIDFMGLEPNPLMRGGTWKEEQNKELAWRVGFVNGVCERYGKGNVVYVSVHVDAAGGDGKWHSARGFSVRVSPKGSAESRRLAQCLYAAAKREGKAVTGNRATPAAGYWEQSLYVLNNTYCPAVLTENLFQDNREDVDWLLSAEGREAVVRLHVEGIKDYIAKCCEG